MVTIWFYLSFGHNDTPGCDLLGYGLPLDTMLSGAMPAMLIPLPMRSPPDTFSPGRDIPDTMLLDAILPTRFPDAIPPTQSPYNPNTPMVHFCTPDAHLPPRPDLKREKPLPYDYSNRAHCDVSIPVV